MSPLQGFYTTGVLTMGLHPWLQPVTPFGVKVSAIRPEVSTAFRRKMAKADYCKLQDALACAASLYLEGFMFWWARLRDLKYGTAPQGFVAGVARLRDAVQLGP